MTMSAPTARTAESVQRGALNEQIAYAKHLAPSDMLPEQYRNKPENVLWAIAYAEMLGLHAMAVINGMHNMRGKPTASSAFITMLVRRAGHRLDVYTRMSGDQVVAVAELTRADAPDRTFTVEWAFDRAKRANLTNKDTWKQFPEAMLKARAATEVARDVASDALFGILYTPEELGADNTDEDGMVTAASLHKNGRNSAPQQTQPAVQEVPDPDPEPQSQQPAAAESAADPQPEQATAEQRFVDNMRGYLDTALNQDTTEQKLELLNKLRNHVAKNLGDDHSFVTEVEVALRETQSAANEQQPAENLVAGDVDYGEALRLLDDASDFDVLVESAEYNGVEHLNVLEKAVRAHYGEKTVWLRRIENVRNARQPAAA